MQYLNLITRDYLAVKSGTTKNLQVFEVLGYFEELSIPVKIHLKNSPFPFPVVASPCHLSAHSHCGFVLFFHILNEHFLLFSLRRKKCLVTIIHEVQHSTWCLTWAGTGKPSSTYTSVPSFVTLGKILNIHSSVSPCVKWTWQCLS